MILYDFACPIDGLAIDAEDVPLSIAGTTAQIASGSVIGKHLHLEVDLELSCANGHVFTLEGSLLLNRSA